ncbi:acyl CoA:acetate/3-ketoacid CoA transferase subunit beta [Bacillus pseudomycoides]|uniref:Acyl CoA:acetate/3-ketoacid CoA transferase subunit beta n=1 Tax=Bacillus pseudomycoides TaxID=64104 RepID=A0AA91VCL0_9BACI|nr:MULTISPECIES: CoA transferase subunit B [Bacillus]PEB51049.1 acyl CoA:acetate/3-ketoacid CoA transferase subunit beta [Bacillus sp. AFS098217]PED82753.1 acyl CoA:acetate/3-ketoacid CoA transferase subunit beta [Bacillus pseudomycoides]PEU15602.1 acyl CoA:acetate/3-ketoacid CoA transferase subunit beta [Bacillus sp. AFS014408]PEU16356.1 acyl CoA:acetate/3-ketoacid CoA transferase subunit beta [Bacillus sp. AFS019443]PFW65171.1 acyl CoA:acetate/3-ketoacid CoA transferase subunit beta [Bacillu
MGMGVEVRDKIAKRAAKEIQNGMIVNLGIGIPSLVPNHLPEDMHVMFHAENGIVGMGPTPSKGSEDGNLCNAAGLPTSLITGASYFDSCMAFGMIRKGLLDITILGSLQVSENGDLANWIVPGKRVPGIGGAMDLAQKAKRVVVVMNHVDKYGNAKIVSECTLPLTSKKCVDLIITDMAVMEVTSEGLVLQELMSPYTVEDVKQNTEASFHVSSNLLVIE